MKIKNTKLDNEVRCFKRINALVKTRQMQGSRRTDKKGDFHFVKKVNHWLTKPTLTRKEILF